MTLDDVLAATLDDLGRVGGHYLFVQVVFWDKVRRNLALKALTGQAVH
jgi:hypothetical protein